MDGNNIINHYFDWMYDKVSQDRFPDDISYRKLLMYLHTVKFVSVIHQDINRELDGVNLRWKFACDIGEKDNYREIALFLEGPCTVLEMMIALAIRCEQTIMDDAAYGDRTGQWFWGMINSLGLGNMYDEHFNKDEAYIIVSRLLNRSYQPDGKGGLFTIRGFDGDLRDVDIWTQLCWYLDSIS
jgi:hypothetical protein